MSRDLVKIKGKNDRLEILLSDKYRYADLKQALFLRLCEMKKFLGDSDYKVYVCGGNLSIEQKKEIADEMRTDHLLTNIEFCSYDELKKLSESNDNWGSIFKLGNVELGQKLVSDGDITVIGNADGDLIARGNICVMGKLTGRAHAGAYGYEKAIIVASVLSARLIQIGAAIGVPPEGDEPAGEVEIAFIENGMIAIESLSEREL